MTLAATAERLAFARALVFSAGFDPLRDEGEVFAQHLTDAGVRRSPHHDGLRSGRG